jgi:hypothetical protein
MSSTSLPTPCSEEFDSSSDSSSSWIRGLNYTNHRNLSQVETSIACHDLDDKDSFDLNLTCKNNWNLCFLKQRFLCQKPFECASLGSILKYSWILCSEHNFELVKQPLLWDMNIGLRILCIVGWSGKLLLFIGWNRMIWTLFQCRILVHLHLVPWTHKPAHVTVGTRQYGPGAGG